MLSIRDECRQAQIAFFLKQWGGWNKKAAGRILEGRTYDEMPPRVNNPLPDKKGRLAIIEQVTGEQRYDLRRRSNSIPVEVEDSDVNRIEPLPDH